jgi:hypothetical protein
MGEAIRMHLRLDVAITRVKIGQVKPEGLLQSEQREMIALKSIRR